jgi:enoyl-CoA hydratase
MADKSPLELELAKKAINAGLRMGLEEGLEYESELFEQMFTTANKEEGIGAFLRGNEP